MQGSVRDFFLSLLWKTFQKTKYCVVLKKKQGKARALSWKRAIQNGEKVCINVYALEIFDVHKSNRKKQAK